MKFIKRWLTARKIERLRIAYERASRVSDDFFSVPPTGDIRDAIDVVNKKRRASFELDSARDRYRELGGR